MSSNETADPVCSNRTSTRAIDIIIDAQPRAIDGIPVGRVLPSATRGLVGPFMFFDHFGPAVIAELSSSPGTHLRRFASADEVLGLHAELEGDTYAVTLQIHAAEAAGALGVRHITLTAPEYAETPWREAAAGWGLIQLYLGGVKDGGLHNSHTNHNSEARARKWATPYSELGPVDAWDWTGVAHASRRLIAMVRRRSISKHGSRPVLRAAHAALESGLIALV